MKDCAERESQASLVLFSVGFAVFSHRRQVNAEIYLDLSDRLHKTFRAIPIERRTMSIEAQKSDEIEDARSRAIVLDFLHLMHSAHTLHAHGYFSGGLWAELEAQAERGLHLPVFRAHWPVLRVEFDGSARFVAFVDSIQDVAATKKRSS